MILIVILTLIWLFLVYRFYFYTQKYAKVRRNKIARKHYVKKLNNLQMTLIFLFILIVALFIKVLFGGN